MQALPITGAITCVKLNKATAAYPLPVTRPFYRGGGHDSWGFHIPLGQMREIGLLPRPVEMNPVFCVWWEDMGGGNCCIVRCDCVSAGEMSVTATGACLCNSTQNGYQRATAIRHWFKLWRLFG